MKTTILIYIAALIAAGCAKDGGDGGTGKAAAQPEGGDVVYDIGSAVALAPTGEWMDFGVDYPDSGSRTGAHAGIFYFIWQGAHGYDKGSNVAKIVAPASSDVRSPYDISILEKGISDPQRVLYGPQGAHHFWGKPYLDYYVGNDPWVLRKHAQMLCDAGIEVIFVDVTNGFVYPTVVKVLCDTYLAMRNEGNPTPQISFVVNGSAAAVVNELYGTFYTNSAYASLWYDWKGRPLLLAPAGDYGACNEYFTFRYAWFDSVGHGAWFGDGAGKWTWGDYYPQAVGNSEQMSVLPATHAHTNLGRSYVADESRGGTQPASVTAEMSGAGTYFKKQFDRALEVDPEFIFITGWNEWVAQRQVNNTTVVADHFLGKKIGIGDTYFVDCYNHEYSRDLEPMEGGFGDNYYYYMVDYLRKYKGITRVEPAGASSGMTVDGSFDDWKAVTTWYKDDSGDVRDRSHFGFGWNNRSLTNTTGRNDIVYSKVATDGGNLYFYVQTAADISSYIDSNWMRLLIGVDGLAASSWEGFHFIVNNGVNDGSTTTLASAKGGGWGWESRGEVQYRVSGREMEIAVPLASLGITDPADFTVDFKWADNTLADGDIMECMRDGDSVPNGRFRYRCIFRR